MKEFGGGIFEWRRKRRLVEVERGLVGTGRSFGGGIENSMKLGDLMGPTRSSYRLGRVAGRRREEWARPMTTTVLYFLLFN